MASTSDYNFAQKKWFHSIQAKLILVLLTLLVPILLIQFWIYLERFESRRGEELQANLEIARVAAKCFGQYVDDILHQELAIGVAATFSPSLSPDNLSTFLEANAKGIPAVIRFNWIGPNGHVLASSDPGAVGLDFSDRRFVKEIQSGRDWFVSDLQRSRINGKPIVVICRAVRDESLGVVGIVNAAIDPNRLNNVIAVERFKDGGINLIDSRGMLVCRHPETKHRWGARNRFAYYPILKEVLSSREVIASVKSRTHTPRQKRLVAFTPVPGLGWIAAASRAEDLAVSSIRASILPQTIAVLFATIAAFGPALFFSRRLSVAIGRLRDHALATGRGEDPGPACEAGTAELCDLANALNQMRQDIRHRESERNLMEEELRKSRDELDLRVVERTAALENANQELRKIPCLLIAAQEEERKRVAAELHDSIGQILAAIKFRVEHMLLDLKKGWHNKALENARELVPTIQRAMEETRTIYMGLRPRVLEDFGVLAALRWYRDELLKLYPERHIELDLGIDESRIPEHLTVPIFRIAQEALNNVCKHSRAEWVDLSLLFDGNGIELTISDDGVGMNMEQMLGSGSARCLGMTSMKERAEMFGGTLSIESAPGKGTTLRASWLG